MIFMVGWHVGFPLAYIPLIWLLLAQVLLSVLAYCFSISLQWSSALMLDSACHTLVLIHVITKNIPWVKANSKLEHKFMKRPLVHQFSIHQKTFCSFTTSANIGIITGDSSCALVFDTSFTIRPSWKPSMPPIYARLLGLSNHYLHPPLKTLPWIVF